MLKPEELKARLTAAFPDAQIELIDLTGTADHYECHLATDHFLGLPLIKQHRLVYEALSAELKGPIHALSLKTYSLSAWAKR